MSRKQCRRKHWPLVNPVATVIEGVQVTAKEKLDQVRVSELTAIDLFTRGLAGPKEWRNVADMLNVAETMANGGVGAEALPVCESVTKALERAHDAHQAGRPMILNAQEIRAMRELYEWHDLQRTALTHQQYREWIERTANRIRSAHPSVKRYVS
jgi:hypothetical protein